MKEPFSSLPTDILNQFNEFSIGHLKGKNNSENRAFGSPRKDLSAIKNRNRRGQTSYTVALKKLPGASKNHVYFDNMVITELPDGKEEIRILRYYPHLKWYNSPTRNNELYSGSINFYSSTGEKLGELTLANDEDNQENQQKDGWTTTCKYEMEGYWCYGGNYGPAVCTYEFEEKCTQTYIDSLDDESDNGGPSTEFEPNEPTGGGVTTTPIAEKPTEIPREEEDKIDDSRLKDCHSKIIDTLKTVNTGIMGGMIQKLAGSNPTDYNWKIDYQMPSGSDPFATAVTDPIAANFTSTTHINLNRVHNSTDLSMARTFAHEAVHAFLVYQYRYDRNASELNYTQLLNNYAAQHNNNINDTHHVLYLKENLIIPIANALQEIGAKLGYNLPHSYYKDLAYGGLYNSFTTNTIFNNLVPNQADRDRIKNRLSAEADNTNVNGISPEGQKAC